MLIKSAVATLCLLWFSFPQDIGSCLLHSRCAIKWSRPWHIQPHPCSSVNELLICLSTSWTTVCLSMGINWIFSSGEFSYPSLGDTTVSHHKTLADTILAGKTFLNVWRATACSHRTASVCSQKSFDSEQDSFSGSLPGWVSTDWYFLVSELDDKITWCGIQVCRGAQLGSILWLHLGSQSAPHTIPWLPWLLSAYPRVHTLRILHLSLEGQN